MGLGTRARKLVAARAVSVGRKCPPIGLAWCDYGVVVDRATLLPGQRVVADHVVLERRAPEDADIVEIRERIAVGPGDCAVVLAWDGSIVGHVVEGRHGGFLLEFAWPKGLPASDPKAAAGA